MVEGEYQCSILFLWPLHLHHGHHQTVPTRIVTHDLESREERPEIYSRRAVMLTGNGDSWGPHWPTQYGGISTAGNSTTALRQYPDFYTVTSRTTVLRKPHFFRGQEKSSSMLPLLQYPCEGWVNCKVFFLRKGIEGSLHRMAKDLLPLVNTLQWRSLRRLRTEINRVHCFCLVSSQWKFIIYAVHFQTSGN